MNTLISEYSEALSRCSYCHDQCMSASAEVVATGDQSLLLSRIATMIQMMESGMLPWNEKNATRLFYNLNDGLTHQFCIRAKEGHRYERFLQGARAEAVRRGLAPASVKAVAANLQATENAFGLADLRTPCRTPASPEAPLLIHDAAARLLTPGAITSGHLLLEAMGAAPGELAVASCGAVEWELGLTDQAVAAARQLLEALPDGTGPLVTTDPVLACALTDLYPRLGLQVKRPVLHISQYLAGQTSVLPLVRPWPVLAVFHDPGALSRGLGVVAEVRHLLSLVPGLRLTEPASFGQKAGSDGPLAGYPSADLVIAIARSRMAELKATGAAVIISASPYSTANLSQVPGALPVIDLTQALAGNW